MKEYILYGHGGSRNHGCEAIVRSTIAMINEPMKVYTTDIDGDHQYHLESVAELYSMHSTAEAFLPHIHAAVSRRIFHNYGPLIAYQYKDLAAMQGKIMISVGGDNYCNGHPYSYIEANKLLSKKNKTVLWGCSVTPELLKEKTVIDDMNRYSLITARESLTYDAIVNSGVTSKVLHVPDPAFTLESKPIKLDNDIDLSNCICINLSPLVEQSSGTKNPALEGVYQIVDYIIENTDLNIVLLPHVIWDKSDDLKSLKTIYNKYRRSKRVYLIDVSKQLDCRELKFIISKCKMVVAARTHASIAAYSTCVPTLVLGYSVKSRGIAKDIFGTEENYVVSVQGLSDGNPIRDAFIWQYEHCNEIKKHLVKMMPDYIQKARTAGDAVKMI